MRIHRFAAALAGAGLVLLGSSSAMAASPSQVYPPVAPSLTVSANSLSAGGSVTVTAKGFLALSTASVTWTGSGALGVGGKAFGAAAGGFRMGAKSASADASGVVTASIRLISTGDHTITVAGTGVPAAMSTSSTAPAASVTLRGSSGSENTRRIVDDSIIGRSASGFAGSAPLTATSVGAAARGRCARVVKLNRGPDAGRFVG